VPEAVTEDVLFQPARELGERIRQGKLSPVDLTEACLARLEKYGERLGAVVTICRESALAEAKAAEAEIKAGKHRGPLHGVPFGVKDLLATKGIPTTWGAAPYKDRVIDRDATAVVRLRSAGAILVAKLAMVELAGGFGYDSADASFTGPGRTPWNRDFWSGGSSSGSGAAVAAGLVPFAIGSETSGSIITPAAYCGVSGLRPTYGRVSRAGAMALCWSLDKLGPMCRTADDCALVLAALAGPDPADPTTSARKFEYAPAPPRGKDGGRPKVAVVKGALDGVQPAVKKNFQAALEVIAKFADVADAEIALPDLPWGPAVGTIVSAEGAAAFRDLLESGKAKELTNEADRTGGYPGLFVLAVDYLAALRQRGRMKRELDAAFAPFDAVLAPSRATVALPVGKPFAQAYPGFGEAIALIPAGNLTGQPALSVPNGFGDSGLPTGIQFAGRAWSEGKLVALAAAYQAATDWHAKRPKLE
jgi:aspartyl-tRNA(Asn)/glutamyl-tRNA(Gln) amidotransferase subunit A